ncbi:hypothetical protein LOK49_LG15G00595 [Camellia lanceoleosa]|uniref:Uncharacterized protein n=1 Tax=Camellia lanceoleosa TaxID=1840588 RepID=A0ACC0F1F5_9ERIC|nr:hypothetical protein LOK49_LG15G00595 [Camellia lanceoleosa]
MIIILIFLIIVTTKPVLAYRPLEGDEAMAGHGTDSVEPDKVQGSPPGPSGCTYIGGGNNNGGGGGGCHHVTTKPLEAAARPFHGRKVTVAHGGVGGGGGGGSESALTHKPGNSPPAPSPCTYIPIGGGNCNNP